MQRTETSGQRWLCVLPEEDVKHWYLAREVVSEQGAWLGDAVLLLAACWAESGSDAVAAG